MDDKLRQQLQEQLKGPLLAPVVAIVVILVLYFFTSKVSMFDYVADKVIDRMDAKYSPYGPPPPVVYKKK